MALKRTFPKGLEEERYNRFHNMRHARGADIDMTRADRNNYEWRLRKGGAEFGRGDTSQLYNEDETDSKVEHYGKYESKSKNAIKARKGFYGDIPHPVHLLTGEAGKEYVSISPIKKQNKSYTRHMNHNLSGFLEDLKW
jgi:hypothetical protein